MSALARGTRLRTLGRYAALCVALLFGIELAVRIVERHTGLLPEIVDIQTAATLYAKLDYLRRFDGIKVVVLGDSVIYGRAMGDAGERDWRRHTLSARLQERLDHAGLGRPVLVLNLGMNGALMKDLERLVPLLHAAGPDKLVIDVTLRSFSADFAPAGEDVSRPWLGRFEIDRDGRYSEDRSPIAATQRLESLVRELCINHWALYRVRDFVQWRALNGEPAMAVRALRAWIDGLLAKSANSSPDAGAFEAALLRLKAKNRHESVTLDAANPQVQAFERMLRDIASRRIDTVVFYATEDARQIGDIMPAERYQRLLDELVQLVARAGGERVTYVPPLAGLGPENYVDYVHPNRAGYERLADAIFAHVRADLR